MGGFTQLRPLLMIRTFLAPGAKEEGRKKARLSEERAISPLLKYFVDYSPMVSPNTSGHNIGQVEVIPPIKTMPCQHPKDKTFEVDYYLTCTICGVVLDDHTIVNTLEHNGNLWGQVHTFMRRLVVNRSHRKELFEKTLREMLALEAKPIPESLIVALKDYMFEMNITAQNKSLLAIIKHHLKETNRKTYYNHLFKIAALLNGHVITINGVSMENLRLQFARMEAFMKENKGLYISNIQYVIKRLLELNGVDVHYRLVISEDTRRKYDHRWQEGPFANNSQ